MHYVYYEAGIIFFFNFSCTNFIPVIVNRHFLYFYYFKCWFIPLTDVRVYLIQCEPQPFTSFTPIVLHPPQQGFRITGARVRPRVAPCVDTHEDTFPDTRAVTRVIY